MKKIFFGFLNIITSLLFIPFYIILWIKVKNKKIKRMKQLIKRILLEMALIPKDKLLHFFYGSIIATPLVIWGTTIEAVCFMIFISVGKEIIDAKMRFSPPNVIDALFTFLPIVLLLSVKLLSL